MVDGIGHQRHDRVAATKAAALSLKRILHLRARSRPRPLHRLLPGPQGLAELVAPLIRWLDDHLAARAMNQHFLLVVRKPAGLWQANGLTATVLNDLCSRCHVLNLDVCVYILSTIGTYQIKSGLRAQILLLTLELRNNRLQDTAIAGHNPVACFVDTHHLRVGDTKFVDLPRVSDPIAYPDGV